MPPGACRCVAPLYESPLRPSFTPAFHTLPRCLCPGLMHPQLLPHFHSALHPAPSQPQDYLSALRAAHAPWRDIYWHVWGLVHVLYCHACHQHTPAAGLRRCTYHPQAPVFSAAAPPPPRPGSAYAPAAAAAPATAFGFYPCCGASASRTADPRLAAASGCCAREHRLLPSGLGPGAPLPPGLSPALLDTLRRFPDLFSDAADAPLPKMGAAAGPGRPFTPRAANGDGSAAAGSDLGTEGAGTVAGPGEHAREGQDTGEGRAIPPSIRAVLDAAAASAAAAATARRREVAAGTNAAQGLGPAAAAAAAALGYHVEPGSVPGGGVGSVGKGPRAAVAPAGAVPGSPLSLTGDPQLDARLVAAAVARRLTNSSGGGRGAAGPALTAAASDATSKEVGKVHRHADGPDASHARSFTSVAVLQQEAEGEQEAGAATYGAAAGAQQPPPHAQVSGSAMRAVRASSARYGTGGDGPGNGSDLEGGRRGRPLTASGQVPAAYLSSPYLPRPGTAKKPGRSSSLDAALAKELQKLAVRLQDRGPGASQAAASQQQRQPQRALGGAASGGAAATRDAGLPPRPGSRAAIQLQAAAKAGHAGASGASGGGCESDEEVYTDDDDYEPADEVDEGAGSEGAGEGGGREPPSPDSGNPLQRSVQAALARAQQRRREEAQAELQAQEPYQPPHGVQAHQHHTHRQHLQAQQAPSRSPPAAVASPPPSRHTPTTSSPVSPTPLVRPERGGPGSAVDAQAGRSPAMQARSPGPGRRPDAAAVDAATTTAEVYGVGAGSLGAAARPGPPLLHSAPAAAALETPAEAERRQLIEAYKTQAVLSPRPAHYQMISIAELPSGAGDLAHGAGAGGATAARLLAHRTSGLGAALAAAASAPAVAAASVDVVGRPGSLAAASGAPSGPGLRAGAAAQSQLLARSWGPEAAMAVEPGVAAVASSRAGFFSLPYPDYDSDSEAATGRESSGGGAGPVGVGASSAARGRPNDVASTPVGLQGAAAVGCGPLAAGAAAGTGGPVSSSSVSAASGVKGRKLRMELLYEDDVSAAAALGFLPACSGVAPCRVHPHVCCS